MGVRSGQGDRDSKLEEVHMPMITSQKCAYLKHPFTLTPIDAAPRLSGLGDRQTAFLTFYLNATTILTTVADS